MSVTPTDRFEASGLELWRGERCLFSGLEFSVASGELLHVRGANGSGKTSLMRVVCGLAPPEEGEVRWNGQPVGRCRYAFHAALAYVGHEDGLHDDLTAVENLVWGLGLKTALDKRTVLTELNRLGLGHTARVPGFALSAGQRRRLALARAVLGGARLWVLDEPLANLDAAAREWCMKTIGEHVDSGGLVMLSSHQTIRPDAGVLRFLEMDT